MITPSHGVLWTIFPIVPTGHTATMLSSPRIILKVEGGLAQGADSFSSPM